MPNKQQKSGSVVHNDSDSIRLKPVKPSYFETLKHHWSASSLLALQQGKHLSAKEKLHKVIRIHILVNICFPVTAPSFSDCILFSYVIRNT